MALEEQDAPAHGTSVPMTRDEEAQEWQKKFEEIFKCLPMPSIPKLPDEHASDLSKYKNRLNVTPAEAWQKCADAVEKYDADTCKFHREEIDTLLVFAGLFSAMLTAFTIESYQWLQADPDDAIISLLSQLVPAAGPPEPTGLPDAVSVRINAYWFLSLVLSISAALVAILCKQWVREFERRAGQSHEQFISTRQMKLEGFEGWGVASIIAAIPVLLQSALGLFALGLIELLWKLNVVVAIVALVPALAAAAFYIMTTVLPGLQIIFWPRETLVSRSQCPFKSPQALGAMRILLAIRPWSSICVSILLLLVTYVVRKCLALGRRLLSYRSGDFIIRVCRHLGHRLLFPWQRNEAVFYDGHTDLLNSGSLRRWWRKLRLRRGHGEGFSNAAKLSRPFRPKHQHLVSWTELDCEFNAFRDSAYLLNRYESGIEFRAKGLPLRSCFRGLAWVRDHFDQPGTQHWVWLSVWDITTRLTKSLYLRTGFFAVQDHPPATHHGIVRLMHETNFINVRMSPFFEAAAASDLDAVLAYTLTLDLEPAFMAELVIHHLSRIDRRIVWHILSVTMHSLRNRDDDSKHSVVHAILARALTWDRVTAPDVCRLLLLAARSLGPSLSHETLACVVAAYFHRFFAWEEDILDARGDFQELFLLAVQCLTPRADNAHSYNPTTLRSTEVQVVLGTLVLALDDYFHQLPDQRLGGKDYEFVTNVLREPARSIYLALLAGSRDDLRTQSGGLDIAAAEDRMQRTIGRFARKRAGTAARHDVRRLRRVKFAPTSGRPDQSPTVPAKFDAGEGPESFDDHVPDHSIDRSGDQTDVRRSSRDRKQASENTGI